METHEYNSDVSFDTDSTSSGNIQPFLTNTNPGMPVFMPGMSPAAGSDMGTGFQAEAMPMGQIDAGMMGQADAVPMGQVDAGIMSQADAFPMGQADAFPMGQADAFAMNQTNMFPTMQPSAAPMGQADTFSTFQPSAAPMNQADAFPMMQPGMASDVQPEFMPAFQSNVTPTVQQGEAAGVQPEFMPTMQPNMALAFQPGAGAAPAAQSNISPAFRPGPNPGPNPGFRPGPGPNPGFRPGPNFCPGCVNFWPINNVLWTWRLLGPAANMPSQFARVRFYNASSIREPLNIFLNSRLVLSNLDPRSASGFLFTVPGTYRLTIYRSGILANPVIDTNVTFFRNRTHLLTITGTARNARIQLSTQ